MSRGWNSVAAILGVAAMLASVAVWPLWWVAGPLGCAFCVVGVVAIRRGNLAMFGYVTMAFGVATVIAATFTALVLTASAGPAGVPMPSQTAARMP